MDSVLGHEHSDIRIRTCIAHRHRKPDVDLLRIVAEPHPAGLDHGYIATPDPQRRKPGRGAWLTPNLESLDLAEKRRAFHRAFKVSGQLDTGLVSDYLHLCEGSRGGPREPRRTEH